ncbi:hypothetical protein EDB86DRAFT_2977903 [Lactarius hatsudake]|nr:hypothetical protein EDB86DRAFT_2977903 [Lactarius hatsudake]
MRRLRVVGKSLAFGFAPPSVHAAPAQRGVTMSIFGHPSSSHSLHVIFGTGDTVSCQSMEKPGTETPANFRKKKTQSRQEHNARGWRRKFQAMLTCLYTSFLLTIVRIEPFTAVAKEPPTTFSELPHAVTTADGASILCLSSSERLNRKENALRLLHTFRGAAGSRIVHRVGSNSTPPCSA